MCGTCGETGSAGDALLEVEVYLPGIRIDAECPGGTHGDAGPAVYAYIMVADYVLVELYGIGTDLFQIIDTVVDIAAALIVLSSKAVRNSISEINPKPLEA